MLMPCSCDLTPKQLANLERRESEHRKEYDLGELLTMAHLSRLVITDDGPLTVWELLRRINYRELVRELPLRATDEGLIQLVYLRNSGSKLVRWRYR